MTFMATQSITDQVMTENSKRSIKKWMYPQRPSMETTYARPS